jgi:ankyrin repeat protein
MGELDSRHIKKLLKTKNMNIDAQINDGATLLHMAVMRDCEEVVRLLLNKGANPNVGNLYNNTTPLHFAAKKDYPEIAKILCDTNKVNVNAQDNERQTPLHWAAENGNRELVTTLLIRGADINMQDNEGRTPFHCAVRAGHIDTVEWILGILAYKLKVGTDSIINAQDHYGRTPLHSAVGHGHYSIVSMLVDTGADANIVDYKGHKPIDYVKGNDNTSNLMKQRLEYGARNPLERTIKFPSYDRLFKN